MNKDMFQSASVKLTLLYTAIIMGISLTFSVWLYNVSISEIKQSVIRAPGPIERMLRNDNQGLARELREAQNQVVADARTNLLYQLTILNVLIVGGGVGASYYLARRTLRPIEQAHDSQRRFTADASHELRTPLAVMQSEIEVALMDAKPSKKELEAVLKSNLEEVQKMSELSEHLLRLAQLDEKTVQLVPVSLSTVTKAAVARVEPLAQRKDIQITADHTDLKVLAEEQLLGEAIAILLDNAVKYSPSKTTVTLRVQTTNRKTKIEVIDNGPGIKESDQQRLFERFYRADQSRSKHQVAGYGLGLSIAKRIVELHKGDIELTSKPGKGSTFTITLPS